MKRGTHFYPPPRTVVAALEKRVPGFWRTLAASIDRGAAGLDVTATNWFRDATHNARVGGANNSQHRWGVAFDLAGPGARTMAERLREDGWTTLDEGDHVHVQAFRSADELLRAGVGKG